MGPKFRAQVYELRLVLKCLAAHPYKNNPQVTPHPLVLGPVLMNRPRVVQPFFKALRIFSWGAGVGGVLKYESGIYI